MLADPALGELISGIWRAAETVKEASVYGKPAPFQGAFPAAQRKATTTTRGTRLDLEMVHDHTACEPA
jgi:hypothetical protein